MNMGGSISNYAGFERMKQCGGCGVCSDLVQDGLCDQCSQPMTTESVPEIPEDLREEYASAKWRFEDHGSPGGRHKMALIERIARLEAQIKEDDEYSALREQLERAMDLIRYTRHFLHDSNLINDEEFAQLVEDSEGGKRTARLEAYDSLRKQVAAYEKPVTPEERDKYAGGLNDVFPLYTEKDVNLILASRKLGG